MEERKRQRFDTCDGVDVAMNLKRWALKEVKYAGNVKRNLMIFVLIK